MSILAAGVDNFGASSHAIIVDVRSGDVVWEASGAIESIPLRDVIGVGIAGANELDLPRDLPVRLIAKREHARVPGAGVASPSTLVLSFEDGVHVMNSRVSASAHEVIGPLVGAILPEYFTYEIHQPPLRSSEIADVESAAIALHHRCDSLRKAGVPVRRFVATGEFARINPQAMQIFANVLDARIKLAASNHPIALGAAILGALAAGQSASGHSSFSQLIHAMAHVRRDVIYRPDLRERKRYAQILGE